MIVNDFKDRKAKAESNKTKMLDLATRFYNMTVEQARQYISLKHEPEESAVKNLIDEYLEGEAVLGRSRYIVYKCNYCERDYYNLQDFEYHCYNNRQDHKPATISNIEHEAKEAIMEANREYEKDIFVAIQAKKTAGESKQRNNTELKPN